MTSYYGRPIIKEPVWKPEIPTYFFTGGLAGGAAL
ncbi:MAG: nitrite reductase, partial [Actinobacteria bacterium]